MDERTDRKLRHVAVGHYAYRHEAEFAAGFLEEAGIPYRMQVDDPALGMPLSASATIWVRAMDEERAREALHIDQGTDQGDGAVEGQESNGGDAVLNGGTTETPLIRSSDAPPGSPGSARSPRRPDRAAPSAALRTRERLLVLGAGIALLGLMWLGVFSSRLWSMVAAVVGAGFLAAALLGRAPRFLKRALSALSGEAP